MAKRILVIGNSDGIGAAVTTPLLARCNDVVGVSRSPSPFGDNGPRHDVMAVADAAYPARCVQTVRVSFS